MSILKKYKIYKELPDWKVCRVDVKYFSNKHKIPLEFPSYDIFVNMRFRKHRATNGRWQYIGSIGTDGYLRASCIDPEMPFFGTKIKQAVRYLYLKTQEPK